MIQIVFLDIFATRTFELDVNGEKPFHHLLFIFFYEYIEEL